MRKLLYASLIVVFLLISGQTKAQDTAQTWCVSVWYPSAEHPTGMDSILNNPDVIDTVNPFWYNGLVDGTILPTLDAENEEQLAAWREAGLKILPSIWDGGFSQAIHDPTIREKHIAEIVALVEKWEYDGIDVDYESFPLSTRDHFSNFIEDLAAALHEKGLLISMAVHAKTNDETAWESAKAQDWSRLAPAVDIFAIMTYDYHNRAGEAGPIGPPQWSHDVIAYAANFTDLSKVRLGLHFYGYSWRRGNQVAVVPYVNVHQWLESFVL
jgi:spore germination protein